METQSQAKLACDVEGFVGAKLLPGFDQLEEAYRLRSSNKSVLDQLIWKLTGLVRVFVRRHGEHESDPVPLRPPATVVDVARTIHAEVADACRGANVWGPSARFPGQRVGRDHVVADDDTVEIVTR